MDLSLAQHLLILVAGILTGIINTLAGSGSLVTLPIFILLCGLPSTVANGTNRIGALFQSGVGIYGFQKQGLLKWKGVEWLVVPAVLGAIVGSYIAAGVDEEAMNYAIGGLMVFMLLVLLVNPKRWIIQTMANAKRNRHPLTILVLFLIGIYGGFIQAGVGIFLLASLVLAAKYSLTHGNAIKLLIVFLFNIPTLIIFFYHQQVHIGFGLLMAIYQSVGAVLGVRFVAKVPNANIWIHRLLILIVVVSAAKFLGLYDFLFAIVQ